MQRNTQRPKCSTADDMQKAQAQQSNRPQTADDIVTQEITHDVATVPGQRRQAVVGTDNRNKGTVNANKRTDNANTGTDRANGEGVCACLRNADQVVVDYPPLSENKI
jgi:hypothetical protein